MPPVKVFVSGDQSELEAERDSVIIAIGNIRQIPVAWETSGATSTTAQEWYEAEVRSSEVYVGIFGQAYSEATCDEFLLASNIGLKRLVFLKFLDEPRDPRLNDFIENEIRPRLRYEKFSTPQDLQIRVQRSLGDIIAREYLVPVVHRTGLSFLDQSIVDLIELKHVAYSRELQLSFEDRFSHWSTYNAMKKLVDRDIVGTNTEWHHRWYYPNSLEWEEVREEARAKFELVNIYSRHDNTYRHDGTAYDDYSEYLVEQALIDSGFTIESRHSRIHRGREAIIRDSGAGRPPDLDIIVSARNHSIGVQVKNRLDYPEAQSIRDFLSICLQLQVIPLLIVRMAPENLIGQVTDAGGRVIVFKRWLLRPPFPRSTFNEMIGMGIPAAVYTRVPDFLVKRAREVYNAFE